MAYFFAWYRCMEGCFHCMHVVNRDNMFTKLALFLSLYICYKKKCTGCSVSSRFKISRRIFGCATEDEILWCLFLQATSTTENIDYILNLALDGDHNQLVYHQTEISIELKDHNPRNIYGISKTRHLAFGCRKSSQGKTVSQFIKL